MVRIKVIENKDNIVTVDCFPEDKEADRFRLKIDLYNQIILENSLNTNNNYSIHAAYKLYEYSYKNEPIPEELMAIWY